ncbi:MAG: phosphotransferase [Candidatus Shapirobacteria bacterium]|jgi:hypothetical protein
MKQKALNSSEIRFYELLKGDSRFDFVLFPEKIENNIGYFPWFEGGDLIGKEKKYYLMAVEAIAKFHHFVKEIKCDFIKFDKKYYANSLDLNLNLPEKQMNELKRSLEIIESNYQLIHDDFLPQNVVTDGRVVKIIDWENMRGGFAEHDIGRFLGDLHCTNPNWQKKYYPLGWQDELEECYLTVRKKLDTKYDIVFGKKMIRIGRMFNYLGPIEMCSKSGDVNSPWFLANLEAFENA